MILNKLKEKLRNIQNGYIVNDDSKGFSSGKSSIRSSKLDLSHQIDTLRSLVETNRSEVTSSIYNIQKDMDLLKSSKLDNVDYFDFKSQAQSFMTSVTSGQWNNRLNDPNPDSVNKSIKSLETYFINEIKGLKNAFQIDLDTLECQLQSKIDLKDSKYQYIEMLSQKVDKQEFDNLKADVLDSEKFKEFDYRLEGLERNEHLYQALEQKAEIDHVNKALTEIHEEIDESLRSFENINEALCAENCLGRWYWRSGKLTNS